VPRGYEVLYSTQADLNLDQILDQIVVLRQKNEVEKSNPDHPINRRMLILLGQKNSALIVKARNDHAIFFYGYDGNFPEAFVDIDVAPGTFTINHYGGFAMRWSRSDVFTYNAQKQNLIIVPEISDIESTVNLFPLEKQEQIITFHSDVTEKKYFESWIDVWKGKNKIVIGTRQALFLPWCNLGAIFLLKEGDPIHKSWDMAPRFHARDACLMLSSHHKARLHLLDHTPGIETSFFSSKNVFEPKTAIISPLAKERTFIIHSSPGRTSLLDETILEKIATQAQTTFVFTPQRGSAHYIFCRDCNFSFSCPNCSGNLTFYERAHEVRCHNCKFTSPSLCVCPQCRGTSIGTYGIGTESIEKELKKSLPEKKIIRIDNEKSSLFKKSIERILGEQIIVGTQFAWNKIDWKKIGLMVYANIDSTLMIPEFKKNEHIWYSLRQAQYSLPENAELLIQTRKPEHPVFSALVNPELFYENEIKERKKFSYPPFAFLVKLYHGSTNQDSGQAEASRLHHQLKNLTKNSQNITIMSPLPMKPFFRNKKFWHVIVVKVGYAGYKRDSKYILSQLPANWKVDLNPNSLLSF
jgi:primosomal protein N' (replication factor Y)